MKKCSNLLILLLIALTAAISVRASADGQEASTADPEMVSAVSTLEETAEESAEEASAPTETASDSAPAETAAEESAAERGIAAIQATRFPELLVFPKEESYLAEWKTSYARKAFKAPCLRVERISQLQTGRQTMPYLYEGVEATTVAEENDMSCIIYRGSDNELYAGWIQSIRLLEEFPGETFTVGDEPVEVLPTRDDITVSWSKRSWLDSQQNYSVLSEEVKNCRGFTLEYQIIKENTPNWDSILGPRKIYVRTGEEWHEVGSFAYPKFGAVRVQVWLDRPMDINAVGTIAQCLSPNKFFFRQSAYDFVTES